MRPCSTPCAASSPASDFARFDSEPSTLTKTGAWRRSADVSTPVIVTKPMRGSFSSPTASARTARTDSLTRRIRSLIQCHHPAVDTRAIEVLPVQIVLGVVEQPLDATVVAGDARDRQLRPLPEIVVVDL